MTAAEDAQEEALAELMRGGVLEMYVEDGRIIPSLRMNDIFGYACADSEDVPLDALPLVARMWRNYGRDGLTAWSASVRGTDPIKPRITPRYLLAREAIAQAVAP